MSLPCPFPATRPNSGCRPARVRRAGCALRSLVTAVSLSLCATPFALAAEGDSGPVNLLEDTEGFSIQTPPGAQVTRTDSGGLKVTYSIAEKPSKDLWVSVKRVFKPFVEGNAVIVETPGFDREVLVNVWNDAKQKGFRSLGVNDERAVDLFGLGFRGSGGAEFSGKVHAVEIAMQVSRLPGDHTVEIERFELDR